MSTIDAAVIGCSAGGLQALQQILPPLSATLGIAVIIVSHTGPERSSALSQLLGRCCKLPVSDAQEREPVLPGHVYIAPPDYHLLIEPDFTFALSVDPRVCNVRPAIDVLFISAAGAYRERLAGVVLTGANTDGAIGLKAIADRSGICLVQDPGTAVAGTMPQAALAMVAGAKILTLSQIPGELMELARP